MTINSPTFYSLYVKAKFHWGFACRVVPFGKSRITFKIPPPSTLIGALAYPLSRIEDWPEVIGKDFKLSCADRILEIISSVHAKMTFIPSVKSDLGRIYWYHLGREVKTDAVALEKVYTNPIPSEKEPIIEIIYIINQDRGEKMLGKDWLNKLEACAWAISRVGQKEGIISVNSVCIRGVKLLDEKVVKTCFYFPLEACSNMPLGSWVQETFVDVWEARIGEYADKRKIVFAIPFSTIKQVPEDIKVEISEKGVAINCDGITVITLRRWLGI